ncbi:MAG: hypothetical protein FJ038_03295 [Chloroflexi bacterium]|nr:hypothetical protein [Chloroflexota bacterium]
MNRPAEDRGASANGPQRRWWLVGLAIAALVVIVLAPLASPDPDGLERVGGDQGFLDRAREALVNILPGYAVPFIDDPVISTIVAGLIGVALVFGAMWLLGRFLARRPSGPQAGPR